MARLGRGIADVAVVVMRQQGYEAMERFLAAANSGEAIPGEIAAVIPPGFVYLAFYGEGGKADYLKIGVAANVAARMKGHRTSCPIPLVALYVATAPSRPHANCLETKLLAAAPDRLHGEWSRVTRPVSELLDLLSSAGGAESGAPVEFVEQG